MSRVNKTENNLKRVWQELDDACGAIDRATHMMSQMKDLPLQTQRDLERYDMQELVSLKNSIEVLIMEKGGKVC